MREPPVDPALWSDPEMRAALAQRDIPTVYRLVNRSGVSQRQLARLVGQQQSDVSEILKGRVVLSYDLLVRIADGLGIPRGQMGLAYDETTLPLVEPYQQPEELTDPVKRRAFLAAATAATVGEHVLGEVVKLVEFERLALTEAAPVPTRIGKADVAALRALTDRFRMFGRAGQAGLPDVMCPVVVRAERLLTADASDYVRQQLQSALAELHTLTGWWCYDMHLTGPATWHFDKAIRLAGQAGDVIQMVDAASHAAIGCRELGAANDALKLYQLAQAKLNMVPNAYPDRTAAYQVVLHARTAHAWADLGWSDHAHRELEMARRLPPISDPFELADMDGRLGEIELAIGKVDAAEQYAARSLAAMPDGHYCYVAEARIQLAVVHAVAGQTDAPKLALAAFDAVKALQSIRVRTLLAPLEDALRIRGDSTSTDLAEQARRLHQS